jgi:tetratricopeptide (TPR) repeat protein
MNVQSKFIRNAALALLLGGASTIAIGSATAPVFAAEDPAPDAIDTSEFSRDVREAYTDAVEAFQEDMDIPAAHMILEEALASPDLQPGERYTLALLNFQLYGQQQNLEAAAEYFDMAYDTGVMPMADKQQFFRNLAGVHYTMMSYDRAILYGTQAVGFPNWDGTGDQIVAASYYNSGDLAGAEQFAQSVVDRNDAAGQPTDATIFQILAASLQEQGKEAESMIPAGRLAVVDPSPMNWGRVIDYATVAPNLEDRDYMNIYRLRRKTGTLAPGDYAGMVNLAVMLGLPSEAQSVLDEAINGGILSAAEMAGPAADVAALTAETEASLESFATEAAAAPTGQEQVVYGELLLGYERYAEAVAAIQAGIAKGGLQNPDNAQMLLGIALLENGDKAGAQQAFQTAEQNSTIQPVAWVWRLYAST